MPTGRTIDESVEALRSCEVTGALVPADAVLGLPDDLMVAATLTRGQPCDVLIPADGAGSTLGSLAAGARVGVSGARRRGFLRAHRRDVVAVPPGNGGGPAEAIRSGSVDAVVLGISEARRLQLGPRVGEAFDARTWVPAPGQGTLLLLCRRGDDASVRICAEIDDPRASAVFRAESTVRSSHAFNGDVALGALGMLHGSWIRVWGMAASEDGSQVVRGDVTGCADDPEGAGRSLAELLAARGVEDVLRGPR